LLLTLEGTKGKGGEGEGRKRGEKGREGGGDAKRKERMGAWRGRGRGSIAATSRETYAPPKQEIHPPSLYSPPHTRSFF